LLSAEGHAAPLLREKLSEEPVPFMNEETIKAI
jgi:hypothetical protein